MKNVLIKICSFVIILICIFTINSYAASFKVSSSESKVSTGEEVLLLINTDKKIESATFYIKYDNTKLEYVNEEKSKVFTKDYPEDGILRVVYMDIALQGDTQISFKFKTKENVNDMTEIKVTNLTVQFIGDSTVYNGDNLKDSNFKTEISIQQNSLVLKESVRNGLIAVAILFVLLIIVNVIHKVEKNNEKKSKAKSKSKAKIETENKK